METTKLMRLAVAAALMAALAGCGETPRTGTPAGPADDAAPPADARSDAGGGAREGRAVRGELAAPLPEGVALPFRYYVRSDAPTTSRQGVPRRRIRMEFLEGDAATVTDQVQQAFAAAGFTAGATTTTGDGATRINFRKEGYGRATAVVGPVGNPTDPSAQGQLVLDWPADAAE